MSRIRVPKAVLGGGAIRPGGSGGIFGVGGGELPKLTRSPNGSLVADGPVVAPEIILDPITELQVPDPRRIQAVKVTLIRGTVAVDIKATDELLVFGSNATTATNSMSTTLMDASITKEILTEGAALSSAMVSIPHPIGESASVIAATNAAGFAVTLGE